MTVSGWAEIGESQSPAKMADIAVSLSSVRNFSWLVGIVLIVGVSANAYLVWLSARRRLSVRWETFSLILRYSSIVDMSLCVLLDRLSCGHPWCPTPEVTWRCRFSAETLNSSVWQSIADS